MAYLNYLASVTEREVAALRLDASVLMEPSLLVGVSHLIGYWVEAQPLGGLLGQALDGGVVINEVLWHPLRPPIEHGPGSVRSLHARLISAWSEASANHRVPEDDWFRLEIEMVLRVFRHAAEAGECVVSALEPPADRGRAGRVRVPFVEVNGIG